MLGEHSLDTEKSCIDCTKCCEGWLTINYGGLTADPDNNCQYCKKDQGCVQYDSRPDGCISFVCGYISDPIVPNWLKPSDSNIILVKKTGTKDYADFDQDFISETLDRLNVDKEKNFHLLQKLFSKYQVVVCDRENFKFIDNEWRYIFRKIIKIYPRV